MSLKRQYSLSPQHNYVYNNNIVLLQYFLFPLDRQTRTVWERECLRTIITGLSGELELYSINI